MKQFATIFGFELRSYLKNKIFIGVTAFMVVAIAVMMFFPRLSELYSTETPDETEQNTVVIAVSAYDKKDNDLLVSCFLSYFPNATVYETDADADMLKKSIHTGQISCAFVMDSETSYIYYVDTLSVTDTMSSVANEIFSSFYRTKLMMENGLNEQDALQISSAQMMWQTVNVGIDQTENYWYTYIMIFALYMVIILYGQMVATNVATEKSSRAMEVLITSAQPTSMMFGKVLASCTAGLLQLTCVFGSALVCFRLNQAYWAGNEVIGSVFDIPPRLLVYMLFYFVFGFLIYAFLFGAIGSTASKVEDINTSTMPIVLLFVVAFMVVMTSFMSGSVDSLLMKVCSYIPFISPMAMFARICMSEVAWFEIAVSGVLLVGSVIGVGYLSAKIYRIGVLLYGTTPKIGSVLKVLKKR